MAAVLGVAIQGLAETAARIGKTPAVLDAAERAAVRVASLQTLRLFRQKVTRGILNRRSGAYVDSTNAAEPTKDVAGWKAEVGVKKGAAEKYAAIHETGGTIRPKRGKYLTIPVGEALTGAGVARYSGPLDPELDGRDIAWIFPKGKNPLVVERDENDDISVLFVAVKEVKIPKREPLGKTAREMQPKIRGIVEDHVAKALARV